MSFETKRIKKKKKLSIGTNLCVLFTLNSHHLSLTKRKEVYVLLSYPFSEGKTKRIQRQLVKQKLYAYAYTYTHVVCMHIWTDISWLGDHSMSHNVDMWVRSNFNIHINYIIYSFVCLFLNCAIIWSNYFYYKIFHLPFFFFFCSKRKKSYSGQMIMENKKCLSKNLEWPIRQFNFI